jgi:hypothetical protein
MTNTKGLGLRTRHKALANSKTEVSGLDEMVALWLEGADMHRF